MNPETASREIMWNVSHPLNAIMMYGFFALSLLVLSSGLWRRAKLWMGGLPDDSRLRNWGARFGVLWDYALFQRGVNRERKPRAFHTLIYLGFIVLLFTTTMVFLDHDLGIEIYHGVFYLGVTVLSDLFGVALIFGVLLAYHRRYIETPDKLHNTSADMFLLLSLAFLGIQGYLLEGLRIHATDDPWKLYSPVGYLFSLPFWSLSPEAARVIHFTTWWAHALTFFACLALLPYTKFFHIFSSSANLYFRELSRPKGAMKYPGDMEKVLEAAAESDGDFRVGVSTLGDLTWKQKMDVDSYTSCGRCQEVCPAYRSGKILSPKWLILDTRDHMLSLHAKSGKSDGLLGRLDGSLLHSMLLGWREGKERDESGHVVDPSRGANPLVQRAAINIGLSADHKLAGEVMDEDVFWACTSCRACMEVCPVGIEHVDLIMDVRRSMALMEGNIPAEAQPSLRAIETRGNPFGPAADRPNWSEGLDVRILNEGEEVDVLYWVGCISAYDKRKQKIARSLSQILNASGLSWGILGEKECCTGDPARRLGEENLFQSMAKQNHGTLKSVKFKTLVANCPHCFNTIKNEYPTVNGEDYPFEVIHHSEFITRLLKSGAVKTTKPFDQDVTFHDPCYLGRYNERYEEPREVLVQLGSRLKEMKDSKERGMCCGAGGGHYWFDMKVGDRVNILRVEQAAETNTKTIATGCPFCLQMMEDGVKYTNREDSMEVRDIAELVAEAL